MGEVESSVSRARSGTELKEHWARVVGWTAVPPRCRSTACDSRGFGRFVQAGFGKLSPWPGKVAGVVTRVGRRGADRDVGQAVLTGRGRLDHFSLSVAAPFRGYMRQRAEGPTLGVYLVGGRRGGGLLLVSVPTQGSSSPISHLGYHVTLNSWPLNCFKSFEIFYWVSRFPCMWMPPHLRSHALPR